MAPWQPWFIGQQGNPGDPAIVEAVRLRLPLLLGPRGRHRRLHQHVGPARDQQEGRRPVPQRRRRQRLGRPECRLRRRCLRQQGYTLTDPGRYQNLTDDFSAQINAFKAANVRDRHRRRDPARLHHLLEPGQAAGLQRRRSSSIAKAILFPQSVEALGEAGTTCRPRSGGRRSHPFKSSLTGQIVGRPRGRLHRQDRPALDAADRLRPFAVRGGVERHGPRSDDPTDAEAVAAAIAATNLDTMVGKVAWNGAGLPPFAAKNVCKTPLVGGQWRLQGRTAASISSSSTTRPRRTSRPAARWKPLA